MDTNTLKAENPKVETKPTPKQHHKHKKAEGKKPVKPTGPPVVETRGRAKSTLVSFFETKKQEIEKKKNQDPKEKIGTERFKNLLAMFDKKPTDTKENKPEEPKKMDASRFSAFAKDDKSAGAGDNKAKPGISMSIQERIEALKNASKKPVISKMDPVLEERKKIREQNEMSDDDDDLSDGYSDEDADHISDDGLSDSESVSNSSGKEENEAKKANDTKDVNDVNIDDKSDKEDEDVDEEVIPNKVKESDSSIPEQKENEEEKSEDKFGEKIESVDKSEERKVEQDA